MGLGQVRKKGVEDKLMIWGLGSQEVEVAVG